MIDRRLAQARRLFGPPGHLDRGGFDPEQGRLHVTDAPDGARRRSPFPILGIDSGDGSELINAHLS